MMRARRGLNGDPEAHTENERYDQQRYRTADCEAPYQHDLELAPDYTRATSINKDRDNRNVTQAASLRSPGQHNGTR